MERLALLPAHWRLWPVTNRWRAFSLRPVRVSRLGQAHPSALLVLLGCPSHAFASRACSTHELGGDAPRAFRVPTLAFRCPGLSLVRAWVKMDGSFCPGLRAVYECRKQVARRVAPSCPKRARHVLGRREARPGYLRVYEQWCSVLLGHIRAGGSRRSCKSRAATTAVHWRQSGAVKGPITASTIRDSV